MGMDEADTRAYLIEPKLKAAGWTDRVVSREFYYSRDHQYSPGKIILVGDRVRRGKGKRVDYLLRYTDGFLIAVVEAKPEDAPPDQGLDEAAEYAQDLELAFAYSTNGHKIVVSIDPANPEKGTWRPPAFQYSLGKGIEDGFLATYKFHRVSTTVDQTGLHLEGAIEQGVEVFIPEEVEPREFYTTPQFEREITLPERLKAMVKHIARLLRKFGIWDKTMVFCVDMEHARLVARLLQDEFGPETGLDHYDMPIISEEGEEARQRLEDSASSEKKAPVVATTAELLSTGVDVPSCRNIAFMKTLPSPILFKQIFGRGSRLDPPTDKYWFRIIDYTGATRLFDEWDRPVGPKPKLPRGPYNAILTGVVFHAKTGDRIVGVSVSIRIGPNVQQGPIRTDQNGEFVFKNLPVGVVTLLVGAPGFVRRELRIETLEGEEVSVEIALKPQRKHKGKIRVEGLEVTIADEAIFIIEATGEQLTLQEYRDYIGRQAIRAAPTLETLRQIWIAPNRRRAFLNELRKSSIYPEVLAEVLERPDADPRTRMEALRNAVPPFVLFPNNIAL